MLERSYKVIEIVNQNTLLIDYGFSNGAQKGDSLRIITTGEPVIIDGKDYGTLDTVKDIVEVVIPYEKFSVCQKITRTANNPLAPLFALQKTMTKLNPLNVDPDSISHRKIPIGNQTIQVGDIAQRIRNVND